MVKGAEGYLPVREVAGRVNGQALRQVLARELLGVECGGNLVVLHTRPGHANALAVELDRDRPGEAMGTVAGDDTIFIAARTSRQAERLAGRLRTAANLR